jgi:hypothetical protein
MTPPDSYIWHSLAARNGCTFLDFYEIGPRKVPLFHVCVGEDEATFVLMPGQTIGEEADRVRAKFKEEKNANIHQGERHAGNAG